MADINSQEKPWQNSLIFSDQKLKVIYNNGCFSDLTINFPGKNIKYKAHKLILAMSSSVFEGMLFGPMAITSSELDLPEDNAEAFKVLLARCYDVHLEPSDIDEALQVYMLADKYFMEDLARNYSHKIGKMLNSENIKKVLEFASRFSFDSLKKPCFKYLISSNSSLFLQKDWLQKLLELEVKISELIFEDSWKNPSETLSEDTIIQILKSEKCKNTGIKIFSGCVTAKVVNNICWRSDKDPLEEEYNQLYLSLTNLQQSNEVISILDNMCETVWIYIHLQCKMIPADRLRRITRRPEEYFENEIELFLSNVDDNGIDWALSAISSLKPENGTFEAISFPRSKLTLNGFKKLLTQLASIFAHTVFPHINVCSSKMPSNKMCDLQKWVRSNRTIIDQIDADTVIELFDIDGDIDGWNGHMKKRGPRKDRLEDNFPWKEEDDDYF